MMEVFTAIIRGAFFAPFGYALFVLIRDEIRHGFKPLPWRRRK